MALSFKPTRFFTELESRHGGTKSKHRSAFYRAIEQGLIEYEAGIPRLTEKGRLTIKRYEPEKLEKDVCLLVSFDIPEGERARRDHLRILLRELSFKKIQQSLWSTDYDHREYLAAEIKEFGLEKYGDDGYWEGNLYIFDGRMNHKFSDKAKDIGECVHCRGKTSNFENCANMQCNRLVLVCGTCKNRDLCGECINKKKGLENERVKPAIPTL